MLTPIEIENKKFSQRLFGYSTQEIDEFMDLIRKSYEELYRENLASKDKITTLANAVKQYKAMEDALQNALVVAQSTASEVQRNAHEQAKNIIERAEMRASEIVADAGHEASKVNHQFEEIKRNAEGFKAKITSLLNSQLEILNEFSHIEEKTEDLVARMTMDNSPDEEVKVIEMLEAPQLKMLKIDPKILEDEEDYKKKTA